MSKSAIVTFNSNVNGDTTGASVGPISYTLTNTPAFHTAVTMPGPANITITIPQLPSPAKFCRFLPPSNSSVNKWLMSTSGDTVGIQINSQLESWISLSTSITQFVLRTDGAETIELYFY